MTTLTIYHCWVQAHDVPPRYRCPAWEGDVHALTEPAARAEAVEIAHIRGELPPYRSMLRASLAYVTSERVEASPYAK